MRTNTSQWLFFVKDLYKSGNTIVDFSRLNLYINGFKDFIMDKQEKNAEEGSPEKPGNQNKNLPAKNVKDENKQDDLMEELRETEKLIDPGNEHHHNPGK